MVSKRHVLSQLSIMNQLDKMDVNTTSITVGTLFALIGIVLTVFNYIKNNKTHVEGRASDYAVYKQKVDSLQKELDEAKREIKEVRHELMEEIKKLDSTIIQKVDKIDIKIDKLQGIILDSLSGKK